LLYPSFEGVADWQEQRSVQLPESLKAVMLVERNSFIVLGIDNNRERGNAGSAGAIDRIE
jgi:hypothetical protein